MKRFIITGALIIWQVLSVNATEVPQLEHPESIAMNNNYLYVSNIGSDLAPTKKDGDGFISRLNLDGKIKDLHFINGLNAPKGMLVHNNILYITDVDHVVGYNLTTKIKVFEMNLEKEGTVFLNDIAIKNNKTLILSSTDTGKIFEIHLNNNTYTTLSANVPGINGIKYDPLTKRIYFVSFGTNNLPNGSLGYIDSSMNIIILSSYIGYLDGISLEKKTGSIIFTDWIAFEKKGKLLKYKISTKKLSTISTTEIGGPADFIYDIKSNKYYIPAMLENAIITINKK